MAAPASATPANPAKSAEAAYVRARAAEIAGQLDAAAAGYTAALADAPGDQLLAARAYRMAIAAGNRELASRTAALLDAAGALPPDGTLLLFANAVSAQDWRRAKLLAARIEQEDIFSFMAPVLRAWIAFGAREGDPLAELSVGTSRTVGMPYAGEHRALLLLAGGRVDEGVAAIRALGSAGGVRAVRLDLAGAAALVKARRTDRALELLHGDDFVRTAARALVAAGKTIPGAVNTPAGGIGYLLSRVATDINRERVTPLSLSLARLATFLAPGNAETWAVAATMLAASEQHSAALAALDRIAPDDPFAANVRDMRIRFLRAQGSDREALAIALAETKRGDADEGDWSRLGDLYADLGRQRDAAEAYRRALKLADTDADAASTLWMLWLRLGGALEQAGDWTEAKAALRRAVQLAPDQPTALNYLGYAQLQRRENLAEAEKLIERASALRPDDAAITDSLGWTYYIRGDIPKAIATLERAAAGEPGEPEINEHLGDAYWAAGRRYEARGAWAAALVYAEAEDAARIKAKIETGAPPAKP